MQEINIEKYYLFFPKWLGCEMDSVGIYNRYCVPLTQPGFGTEMF